MKCKVVIQLLKQNSGTKMIAGIVMLSISKYVTKAERMVMKGRIRRPALVYNELHWDTIEKIAARRYLKWL